MPAESLALSIEDDVATITLDTPGSPVNLVGPGVWEELERILDDLDGQQLRGLLVRSGKSNGFSAGADIRWLSGLADDPTLHDTVVRAHRVITRLVGLPVPTVACLHGIVLGGGMELALACRGRVATASPGTRLGLPESTLGLIPGGGGTQLLPRIVGIERALGLLLSGRQMSPAEALAIGLVDDVVSEAALLARAHALLSELDGAVHDDRLDGDVEPAVAAARAAAPRGVPATSVEAIIAAVRAGAAGLDAGLREEGEQFEAIVRTDEAVARTHLFVAERDVARRAKRRAVPSDVRSLFLLGGGMMGSGIAAEAVDRGFTARVRDVDDEALGRVHSYVERVVARRHGGADADIRRLERIHRLSTSTGLTGLGAADVVVEAVYEDAALKRDVIRQVEPLLRPDAVLASNTSAIPISHLAEASSRPERLIGMHFFSPVDRMSLLEVIPHAGTDPDVVARSLGLAAALGKVAIVVGDSPGFFTSRVYGRWLDEGTRLVVDGATIDQVDRVARQLGFPVGPLQAQDEVSISLVHKVANDPFRAPVLGDRVDLEGAHLLLDALLATGRLGRRAGAGWYRYGADGARLEPDASVESLVEGERPPLDDPVVADRLLYSFVTESFLCLDEGVIGAPEEGDVASVLGIGFPRRLGGPFHHVARLGGDRVLDVVERLDAETGSFAVAGSLGEHTSGRR